MAAGKKTSGLQAMPSAVAVRPGDERRFPTVADLREGARRRVPKFAFDYIEGGSDENATLARNRTAFEQVSIVPRYGLGIVDTSTKVDVLGVRYDAPFGIAPMGLGALVWPDMEIRLASAAQAANIPYVLSTAASASIETIAEHAPDVFWFQLFDVPQDDHRITFDLIERARRAQAKALVLTVDTPVQARRPQDIKNGLSVPFRPRPAVLLNMMMRPRWLSRMASAGTPGCESFRKYLGEHASAASLANYARTEIRGGFAWALIRRIRDAWPGKLVVKGILHPEDAQAAVAIGAEGIIVSNHGGRTFDAAPASMSVLPDIVASVGSRSMVMLDSGARTGLDIVRAAANGAGMVLMGRPFLYSVAALGDHGGSHLAAILKADVDRNMRHLGVNAIDDLRSAATLPLR
jgi:L-lactate dehydrogenase (cytochrome)